MKIYIIVFLIIKLEMFPVFNAKIYYNRESCYNRPDKINDTYLINQLELICKEISFRHPSLSLSRN